MDRARLNERLEQAWELRSQRAVRPTRGVARRICGEGQMALCGDESSSLARVTSDHRIVRGLGACQAPLEAQTQHVLPLSVEE